MTYSAGIEVLGKVTPEYAQILTPEALDFVAKIARKFEPRRKELMAARVARQAELDAGQLPDFLPQTKAVREGDWKIAPLPQDLLDRRTEITGPVERKMMINALNSGAKSFMADFEDSNCPTWENQIEGQINVFDAYRRQIDYTSPEGKEYKLNDEIATLILRPRGWHLMEKHVKIDGEIVVQAYELSDAVAAEAIRRVEDHEDDDGMLGQLLVERPAHHVPTFVGQLIYVVVFTHV